MANTKDIESGVIIEVPLNKEFGFGYVKIILGGDLVVGNYDVLVKPYNQFSKIPTDKKQFDPSEFEDDDILAYPLIMLCLPKIRGKGKWKLLGKAILTNEDKIAPDFIQASSFNGINFDELKKVCEESKFGCRVIQNITITTPVYTRDFESVKHIRKWGHFHPIAVETMMTIMWLKEKGVDPSTFYTKEDVKNNYWIQMFINQVYNRSINFREIDSKNRFKAKIVE